MPGAVDEVLGAAEAWLGWDGRPAPGTWTLREVVHHVTGVTYYAEMLRSPERSPESSLERSPEN